ncbi:MAG: tetratricopeptide repeat protein [Clostridia bacterium]|nr:tetratricopeptide repeat protein [Clostridia bacterium]
MNGCISTERILAKLDEHLHKNDYASAERHLLYWLGESSGAGDIRTELLIRNELMGLYRKLGRESEAIECVDAALQRIDEQNIAHQVGAATTFLNCATVYKAFGKAEQGIALFERARAVYESELKPDDSRLGGLYNNMALSLVDLGRFREADELYKKAIAVMEQNEGGALEVAITYLNMATAAESERGLLDADETVQEYLDKAEKLLEDFSNRDGYYAFVCEKCASVFNYYGRFMYANELLARARRIYGQ